MIKNVLVTGGGGFVGSAIVKDLLNLGCSVQVAGRNKYNHISDMGVQCLVGDISDKKFTDQICNGVDTVFHTAAKAGIWGKWSDYEKTNINGTKNIVDSCLENGVKRLVYTSTPSVVFNKSEVRGGNEVLPYADKFLCHYARSKVSAESTVLACKSRALKTCAIRPHLIWGPGDPHLIPRLIERGGKRALKIVGDGNNLVDITYIDNVSHAHILAANSMLKSDKVCGKAYFIGQESPVRLWGWINELFGQLDIPKITNKISFKKAYIAGSILEKIHIMAGIEKEPMMTRFLAYQLSHSHYFSHARAEIDFGYKPIVTLQEGQKRLLRWLKDKD